MKKTVYSMLLLTLSLPCRSTAQAISYPETKKTDQVDNYFGNNVADPYRWLENDTARDTEAWVKRENKVTEAYLSNIPYREKIKNRITELVNYPKVSIPQKNGDWLTYYKNDGLQNQSILYVQKGLNGKPEILINPNTLSNDGTVALQSTEFSKNQKYFAYAVSASGSDWQKIHIMDFNSKKLLDDKLEYVKFTGMSWNGDDGFYYSGYDRPENEAMKYSNITEGQKVFYHKIGTSQTEDRLVYADQEHPLRYMDAQLTEDERYLILYIMEGTDGVSIKVKDLTKGTDAPFLTIVEGFETNGYIIDNDASGRLLMVTNEDAPNFKVVSVDPEKPEKTNWNTIIPEQKEKLETVSKGGGKLFARYLKDVSSQVKQFNYKGVFEKVISLPGLGTASGFSGHKGDKYLFYAFTSFTYPTTVYKYEIATGTSSLYHKSEAKFNPDKFVTEQVFYKSKDGTRVPMFLIYKKGMIRNGENPVMLYGYGGFNISITPSFSPMNLVFIENGGIYCVANIRGGGEYGESWHKAGMFENKQNVFDDFIAAAAYLIKEKYTNPKKLAIRGRSNGGLLVGACMTQRPDLFQVAIPQVGVLDMLRYQKFTVGWGWVVEYGSSDKKEQFEYLIKYSPLHQLKKGVCYPATLITTGDHDDRVVPAHSFKFAATLQEDQGCDRPTLIRIDAKAGHGAGKPISKLIEEETDVWSFVFYNLGMTI